jgi:hypothetical protein
VAKALVTIGLLAILAPVLPGSVADRERLTLGVLRRDGIVLPFAAFDRGRWLAPWPSQLRHLDLPITLDDVPERWWGGGKRPAEMTAWADGKRLGGVKLTAPVAVRIMCSPQLGVRTDYRSSEPVPPADVQPFPKAGLVTSSGSPIDALPSVARTSPEWSSFAVLLLDEFNKGEDRSIGRFTAWRHPVSRDVRRRSPIELEALYRAPMDEEGWTAYYVEAVRRYHAGPEDEGCGLVTFTSGWVRQGPKGTEFDLASRITYCDRRNIGYMLPLGLMTIEQKSYWIYQSSGYGREYFVIARPTRRSIEVHVEHTAGICDEP